MAIRAYMKDTVTKTVKTPALIFSTPDHDLSMLYPIGHEVFLSTAEDVATSGMMDDFHIVCCEVKRIRSRKAKDAFKGLYEGTLDMDDQVAARLTFSTLWKELTGSELRWKEGL